MTSWIDKNTPSSPVVVARDEDDPSRATPFCDIYCLLLGPVRLHTIACDIGNRRDPILPSKMEMNDAVSGTPYEEGNE